MKRSSVEVLPRNGQYIVRVIENGKTTDKEFNFEQHAHAYADGQHFRLLAVANRFKADGSAELVRGITIPADSSWDEVVDVYAIGRPQPRPSDDVAAE